MSAHESDRPTNRRVSKSETLRYRLIRTRTAEEGNLHLPPRNPYLGGRVQTAHYLGSPSERQRYLGITKDNPAGVRNED